MVISRTLTLTFGSWVASDNLGLCGEAVINLFEIPEGVETITVHLSTKKTKDSYEIKQEHGKNCFLHYDSCWHFVTLLLPAERLLEKAFRLGFEKKLYLSIKY